MGVRYFLTFFRLTPGDQTPQPIFTQNSSNDVDSCKDVPFEVKIALCLWAHEVSRTISRNPLEIEIWVQWTTNRKWFIVIRMVTWLMTSRDRERSRSWPQYIGPQTPLSRQRLEIRTWCQWSTYRKWLPGNQMVKWPMTLRDPERSRSWPQYA